MNIGNSFISNFFIKVYHPGWYIAVCSLLPESKSSIEFAEDILKTIKEKLTEKGLETSMTPFGYLLEFKIHVKGESLAKVWKSI
jgi:Archaea-specific editing domain of threonyl-tRNA synthetase.